MIIVSGSEVLHVFSSLQAVIIPCGLTATLPDEEKTKLLNTCSALEGKLKDAGIRAKGDYRDNYSPGWKFNHWELKVLLFGHFGILRSFSEAVGSSSRMIGYLLNILWQNRSIWRQLLRFPETLQIPRVNFRYRWCSEKIRRSFKVVLLSSIMRAWFERSRPITKIHSNMLENGLRGFKYRFVWCGTLKEIKKRTRFKWPLEGVSERLNMHFCVKNVQHPFFESREA